MFSSYKDSILSATSKALATDGPAGLNVVPVSVLTLAEDAVVLYDFFMDKTVKNIQASPTVALSLWDGLSGLQIKGTAAYETSGVAYEEAVVTMKDRFPDRTLHGIIRIAPTALYDVSAGALAGRELPLG